MAFTQYFVWKVKLRQIELFTKLTQWHVFGFMALSVAYGIVCFDTGHYVSQNFGFLGCFGLKKGFLLEIL
jgi:hypothetical protein